MSFGPLKPPGDTSINAGAGYRVVLGWDNSECHQRPNHSDTAEGADAATNPYNFLASPPFTVGPKGAQELPEGVKPWDAKPAGAGRAGVSAVAAILAVGVAALF